MKDLGQKRDSLGPKRANSGPKPGNLGSKRAKFGVKTGRFGAEKGEWRGGRGGGPPVLGAIGAFLGAAHLQGGGFGVDDLFVHPHGHHDGVHRPQLLLPFLGGQKRDFLGFPDTPTDVTHPQKDPNSPRNPTGNP